MPAGSFFPLGFDAPGAWILLIHLFYPLSYPILHLSFILFSFFSFLLPPDLRFEEEC